jgi:hypothetical protein
LIDLPSHLGSDGEEIEETLFSPHDLIEWSVCEMDGSVCEMDGIEELALAVTGILRKLNTVFPAMFGRREFRAGRYWTHGLGESNACVGIPKGRVHELPEAPIWACYGPLNPEFKDALPPTSGLLRSPDICP